MSSRVDYRLVTGALSLPAPGPGPRPCPKNNVRSFEPLGSPSCDVIIGRRGEKEFPKLINQALWRFSSRRFFQSPPILHLISSIFNRVDIVHSVRVSVLIRAMWLRNIHTKCKSLVNNRFDRLCRTNLIVAFRKLYILLLKEKVKIILWSMKLFDA